jgi:hypothetical protein
MSNPVRQPLFEFADCGSSKAVKAAERMLKIFPDMVYYSSNHTSNHKDMI